MTDRVRPKWNFGQELMDSISSSLLYCNDSGCMLEKVNSISINGIFAVPSAEDCHGKWMILSGECKNHGRMVVQSVGLQTMIWAMTIWRETFIPLMLKPFCCFVLAKHLSSWIKIRPVSTLFATRVDDNFVIMKMHRCDDLWKVSKHAFEVFCLVPRLWGLEKMVQIIFESWFDV